MVHTLPDYTSKWKNKTIFNAVDNGELAARLGALSTYDRRGNVIWMDDFEGAILKWTKGTGGAGSAVALNAESPFRGSQNCKLTSGAAATRYGQISRALPYPPLDLIGFEWWWSLTGFQCYFYGWFEIDNDVSTYVPEVRLDVENKTIAVRTTAGAWHNVVTVTENIYRGIFSHNMFKLVVDVSTGYYVRLIHNSTEYDISTVLMNTGATSNYMRITPRINLTSTAAVVQNAYVDCFIYTFNE